MLEKIKKNNKGFTLVELIVVIAILGVLMAVLVPQYIQYVEKSKIGVDEQIFGEIAHNMELGAAMAEGTSGHYIATLTIKSGVLTYDIAAGEKVDSPVVEAGTAAVATALKNDVQGVIKPADVKIKSKEYATCAITIVMQNGKIVPNTTTGAVFTKG